MKPRLRPSDNLQGRTRPGSCCETPCGPRRLPGRQGGIPPSLSKPVRSTICCGSNFDENYQDHSGFNRFSLTALHCRHQISNSIFTRRKFFINDNATKKILPHERQCKIGLYQRKDTMPSTFRIPRRCKVEAMLNRLEKSSILSRIQISACV